MSPEPQSVRRLRVFVASPGDMAAERECLPDVVARLNRGIGRADSVHIDLWRWEVDARPGLGEPQDLINPDLDQADIVLVLLWKRMGTPTATASSGTEEEITRAVRRWQRSGSPRVHAYICKRPVPVEDLQDEVSLQQFGAVQRLVRELEAAAVVVPFVTTEEFAAKVHDNLQATVRTLLEAQAPASPAGGAVAGPQGAGAAADWSSERSFAANERASALRLRDEAKTALVVLGYAQEAQDSFATAFSELFNNAVTHGAAALEGAQVRVSCAVNRTFVSLSVFNPEERPIQLSRWLREADVRRERDPFAPGGRGLRLLQRLSDELEVEGTTGLTVVLYRERVELVEEVRGDVTIVSVRRGHKNPSLARRINEVLAEAMPEKLVLALGGSHLGQGDDWNTAGGRSSVVGLSESLYDYTRPHSGTTTAIGPVLPHFAARSWLWRIVCPSPGLRALLPARITHETLEQALAALERAVREAE
ncbi:MAG: ATP-binding protein [Planctomycetota bacterium]